MNMEGAGSGTAEPMVTLALILMPTPAGAGQKAMNWPESIWLTEVQRLDTCAPPLKMSATFNTT